MSVDDKRVLPCPKCKRSAIGDLKNEDAMDKTDRFYLFHCLLCQLKWCILSRIFESGGYDGR